MSAARSGPFQRRSAMVGIVTVALVAGVLLVRLTGNTASNGRLDAHRGASHPTILTGATTGASARASRGFAGSRQGAVAAAVAYATASQRWLYFSDDQIRVAVSKIATRSAAPRMVKDVVSDIAMARDQLVQSSGRIWWLVRPLAWRVEDFGGDDASVSVWTVTILSAAGVAAPQSEYVTVTLDLARVDDDWRVDGTRNTPGPTPITGPHDQPWTAEPFDHALDGFTRVDGEPVT